MMTRLAVPGKCGALGTSGLAASGAVSRASRSLSSAGNRLEPSASDRIMWRRVAGIYIDTSSILMPLPHSSIQREKFVAAEQNAHQAGPGFLAVGVRGFLAVRVRGFLAV